MRRLKKTPCNAPATKADYGWLRDALLGRIERLKGCLNIARTNRSEGLLIFEAVINHEGESVELKIAEISGHSVLDQDSMQAIRQILSCSAEAFVGQTRNGVAGTYHYKLR